MNVKNIEISKIKIIPNANCRFDAEDKEIENLMSSISQHGLKEPIGVWERDGNHILVYGFRRLSSCKKLGWETIPAVIEADEGNNKLLITNTIENLHRRGISVGELGRVCMYLKEEGLTTGEIGVRLQKTKAAVEKAILIYKRVPEKFRDKIRFPGHGSTSKNGTISASVVALIIGLSQRGGREFSNEEVGELVEIARKEEITQRDMGIVQLLTAGGLSIKEAFSERKKYKVMTVGILLEKIALDKLKQEDKISDSNRVPLIVYGKLPSLPCPKAYEKKLIKSLRDSEDVVTDTLEEDDD